MACFGYTLSSEEHGPRDLVRQARRAEEVGFDFLSISDHFHPWVSAQGHSPFVWSVLGAIAQATDRVPVGVGVTCPIQRMHPAVLAQAAATTSLLFEGRFFFGVGTGEALNEHVLGHRWPPAETRRLMLAEAVHVIRQLWTGETIDHHGDFYEVENARLFDPPDQDPPLIVSGFGPNAVELAAPHRRRLLGAQPLTRSSLDLVPRVRRPRASVRAAARVLGRREPPRPAGRCTRCGPPPGSRASSHKTFRRGRTSRTPRRW